MASKMPGGASGSWATSTVRFSFPCISIPVYVRLVRMLAFPQTALKKFIYIFKVPICHFLIVAERQYLRLEVPKISPAGTGLWENSSYLYSDDQLKSKLTVGRTLRPEPEPDALFRIREYAGAAFCQPVIAEVYFLPYRSSRFYDGNLKGIRLRLHGQLCQGCHT